MTRVYLRGRRHTPRCHQGQRGVVLVVAVVLLVLLTMVVLASNSLTNSNAKSVGNTQINAEATAAAKDALETVLSTNFTATTAAQSVTVDLNGDATTDYTVAVAAPTCVQAVNTGAADEDNLSSTSLPTVGSIYNTLWDLRATVQDDNTGANVTVHQGVSIQMSESDKLVACP
jgi:Tfp pilus assembly protein PilX